MGSLGVNLSGRMTASGPPITMRRMKKIVIEDARVRSFQRWSRSQRRAMRPFRRFAECTSETSDAEPVLGLRILTVEDDALWECESFALEGYGPLLLDAGFLARIGAGHRSFSEDL